MNDLKMNKEIEKYISLQRTGYGSANIAQCYKKDIQKDLNSIIHYIPKDASNIIDVGCGIGGISLFLYHYYNKNCNLNLLDYNMLEDDVYYGYRADGAKYNSLDLTKEFLLMNDVSSDSIKIHNAAEKIPGYHNKYDVIISLLSCGFHYPVQSYLKHFIQWSKFGGVAILDIRKHSNQIEFLKNYFCVKVIADYSKSERVVLS